MVTTTIVLKIKKQLLLVAITLVVLNLAVITNAKYSKEKYMSPFENS